MVAEAVRRAALDEVFHGPLVELPLPHALDEVFQRLEGAALLPLFHHGANQADSYIFHRAKAEADGVALHGEVVLGVVQIRGQDGNPQFFTFRDISGNFRGGVQHRGHQGRHILPGIVALEIGGLVGHDGIAHRMGLVEGVVGEVHDFVVNGLGHRLGNAVAHAAGDVLGWVAVDEDLPFRLDDLHFLLGNGPADIVGLPHGVAA